MEKIRNRADYSLRNKKKKKSDKPYEEREGVLKRGSREQRARIECTKMFARINLACGKGNERKRVEAEWHAPTFPK